MFHRKMMIFIEFQLKKSDGFAGIFAVETHFYK